MAHRFLNAVKTNWRFSRTLKPNTNLKHWTDKMKRVNKIIGSMKPEEMQRKIMVMLTEDDIKALSPLPDENDPGIFENEPHPNDDVRTHVQVGESQCLVTNYLKRRLEHIPGFPRPVKDTGDKAYRISPTLHSGMGMFAARRFKMEDLIADERPLMVIPIGPPADFGFLMAQTAGEDRMKYSQELVGSVFERMSEENQEAFMGLRNSHPHDGLLFGVARTNGYGLDDNLMDETKNVKFLSLLVSNNKNMQSRIGRYAGVFKDLSRLNHSCSPNIHRKFHMATFSMQIRAARDIGEGEEIFTTYTETLQPAADRARSLAPYSIECGCRACLGPAKSDPIRAAVRNRSTSPSLPPSKAKIDAAVQTLARIEQEGLQASAAYRETLGRLFISYVYVHDEKKALMYGEKLWLATMAAGEPLCEMFRNVEVMKKSPQWMATKWFVPPRRLV